MISLSALVLPNQIVKKLRYPTQLPLLLYTRVSSTFLLNNKQNLCSLEVEPWGCCANKKVKVQYPPTLNRDVLGGGGGGGAESRKRKRIGV